MSVRPDHPRDPVGWSALLSLAFLALLLVRLGIPSQPFFDEVHYLPAARIIMELSHVTNQEHPLLGKEIIALGMMLFGDGPIGWRIFSALSGALALFAFMRALWFAQGTRFAALAGGILLATGFLLFVHSQIAMLDIFMVCFTLVALWMCAGAMREAETGRWRLAIAGVALGCAMASKWNAVPVAMLPGVAFFLVRLWSVRGRVLTSNRGWPVPGISLPEAFIWLGVVPVLTYALTFLPVFFYQENTLTLAGFVPYQERMLELQEMPLPEHPYQSRWEQWVLNLRAIWYLYEDVDGAQRGVMLIGNPFTMWAALPAMAWCAWAGLLRKHWAALAVFVLYAVSLGMWLVAAKAVQFYYHYFLPSCFLLAGLALALDALWRAGYRKLAIAALSVSLAMFGWFYPILSAARLSDPQDFLYWAWLTSWR